jgi:hypothetical protein
MPVRYIKYLSAVALASLMVIFYFSCSPLAPPGPAHPNLVITASYEVGDLFCSSNTIVINGNGKVVYEYCGSIQKEGKISLERIEGLVKIFHENDFFSFNDNYGYGHSLGYESIGYNDKSVIKSVRVSNWICDTVQVRSSDSVVCPEGPGDPCITFSRYSARLRLSGPPGYDTIFHECWKIKEELFP